MRWHAVASGERNEGALYLKPADEARIETCLPVG
jgi:hypothetical protein